MTKHLQIVAAPEPVNGSPAHVKTDDVARITALFPIEDPTANGVVLIGAGRQCHNTIGLVEPMGWKISHILDDHPQGPVLGYDVRPLDTGLQAIRRAMLAVGDPGHRRKIAERCASNAAIEWISMLHPSAVISPHAAIAQGCFVGPFVAAADINMAPHAMVYPFSMLGARVRLGFASVVSSHCSIHSDVEIGDEVMIGTGTRIMAGVKIGNRCRIAPNAVVNRDVPDDHMAATPSGTKIMQIRPSAA